LSQSGENTSVAWPRVEAEHRPLTVMFCDLVDSTTLLVQDSEAYRELIEAFKTRIAHCVERFSGKVKDYAGDGARIDFGDPRATEADVEHALDAARLLIEEIGRIKPEYTLRIRVGIATGDVIIGSPGGAGSASEQASVGKAVHLAARLREHAEPNTIVVCETTHGLAGRLFAFADLGKAKLKGFADPVSAWRVLDKASHGSRFEHFRLAQGLSPFVGRGAELATLNTHIPAPGSGVLFIDVVGEPGIGKSRLLHEFKTSLPDGHVLAGNCSPDGRHTALLPFIDIVRASCGLSVGEDKNRVREKVSGALACIGQDTERNVDLILNLLGLKPSTSVLGELDEALIGLKTRELLLQMLQLRSRMSPLILLLEDLHWIDSTSADLLHRMAAQPNLPLLVVTSRRPEYRPPWLSRSNLIEGPLSRLSPPETRRIVLNGLGNLAHADLVAAMVAETAEGNPLFAEEIALLVASGKALPTGTESDGPPATLPEKIKSLLQSRVDQLDKRDKLLMQLAAVIGRRFDADLVRLLAEQFPDLKDAASGETWLAAMEELDILRRTETPGQYTFKHAFLREVLYTGILKPNRASIHALVAGAIEGRSGNRLAEVAELLAYHYGQTGLVAKAVAFSFMSGMKCFGVYSLEEAIQYFGKALKLIAATPVMSDPQETGKLVAAYLQVLGLQAKYPEVTSIFEKYRPALEQLDDKRPFVQALNSTCFAYFMQMDFKNASEMATRALKFADDLGDPRAYAYAVSALVFSRPATQLLPQDEFDLRAARAIQCSAVANDRFIQVRLLFDLAWYHLSRGAFREGRECAAELMTTGLAQEDTRAVGFANWTFGLHYVCEGSYDEALERSENALKVSLTTWDREGALWVKAGALALSRRVDEARIALKELSELCTASNDQVSLTSAKLFFGVVLIMEGKFAEGVRSIEKCINAAKEAGWKSLADWAGTNLAEVYLEFLAPSQKISTRTVLKNLFFLLDMKINGARRACDLLNCGLSNNWFSPRGYFCARMHFSLGRVLRIRGQKALARTHCEEAKKIAIDLQNVRFLTEIDRELAVLNPR